MDDLTALALPATLPAPPQPVKPPRARGRGVMSKTRAQALTAMIRDQSVSLFALVYEAYTDKAYEALGYTTWQDYVKQELSITPAWSYKLVRQGEVIKALKDAAPEDTEVHVTATAASVLVKHVEELSDLVSARTQGMSPEDAATEIKDIVDAVRAEHTPPVQPDEDGMVDANPPGSTPEDTGTVDDGGVGYAFTDGARDPDGMATGQLQPFGDAVNAERNTTATPITPPATLAEDGWDAIAPPATPDATSTAHTTGGMADEMADWDAVGVPLPDLTETEKGRLTRFFTVLTNVENLPDPETFAPIIPPDNRASIEQRAKAAHEWLTDLLHEWRH